MLDINDYYTIITIIYIFFLLISYNKKLEKIFFKNKNQKVKYRSFCLIGLTFIYIIIIIYIVIKYNNTIYWFSLSLMILCFIMNIRNELIICRRFKEYLNMYDDLLQEYILIYNEYPNSISDLITKVSQKKERTELIDEKIIKIEINEEFYDFYCIYIPIIDNGKVINFILKSDLLYVTLYSENSLRK